MRSNWVWVAAGLCATMAVEAAWATDDGPAAGAPAEEIIVTGTRAAGRTALTSSAPVDVIDAERLDETGYQDLGRALEFAEPSVNFPRAQTTAALQEMLPNRMRGLGTSLAVLVVNLIGLGLGPTLIALVTDHVIGDESQLRYSLALVPIATLTLSAACGLAALRPYLRSRALLDGFGVEA